MWGLIDDPGGSKHFVYIDFSVTGRPIWLDVMTLSSASGYPSSRSSFATGKDPCCATIGACAVSPIERQQFFWETKLDRYRGPGTHIGASARGYLSTYVGKEL